MSAGSANIAVKRVLPDKICVESVPTNVRFWSGIVIVLFAVSAVVLNCAQFVATSASFANFRLTRVLFKDVCSAFVSNNVDAVAVGSAVVVTVPASGKK